MTSPQHAKKSHSKATNSGEQTQRLWQGTKPSQSYSFGSIYKSSYQNNTLRHISTKTLMSPRYSIVTSSIRGHDYTICITQSQIHPTNIKVLQRVPPSYYRRVKNVCQPLCIGSQVSRNPQVDHQNIHQVAHDIPLSPHIITARHTSSVHKRLNPIR